ncbi:MAG: kelch repeat-containing protein [Massilibacteroides sp.]|nr:kelch repeat-containing protein [Massilibacteroides sp.]
MKIKLPVLGNVKENLGVAGAYSGIVDGKLVVLGGANFPDKKPWDGGEKRWWKTLYSFDLSQEEWQIIPDFLPRSMGYGVSIQLPNAVLCIGGCDANDCFSDVFSVERLQGEWLINTDWPPLPVPLACGTGVLCDGKVYVFGGQTGMKRQVATSYVFVLDLQTANEGWKELPTWPGEPKGYAVSVALKDKVYLFSGRNYNDKGLLNVHTDGFVFTPKINTWEKLSADFPVMAGVAFTDEKEIIVFPGGVEEALPTTPDHPGFSRNIKCYNLNTKTLTICGESPYPIPVTTNLVIDNDTVYIVSGEIRPGVRTPYVLRGIIQ